MRTIDLSPLHRFAVGFDHIQRQLDQMAHLDEAAPSYPPYNIEILNDDDYRIVMAVAGFAEKDLDITVENSHLIISGHIEQNDESKKYLHRGIASRAFERRFELADHIKIRSARLDNGLLYIDLVREVPEALKPRKVKIKSEAPSAIEHKAA